MSSDRVEFLEAELAKSEKTISDYQQYVDSAGFVTQYRCAHFEAHGVTPRGTGTPRTRAYPEPDLGLSYEQKLTGMLPLKNGAGVEIGPLCIPIVLKNVSNVIYVDHLDTDGIKKKYPSFDGIVEIDRPIVSNSLETTLKADAPLDYFVASQVFEHVANPIRWLHEIAQVLRVGGLLALSLPDRRMTFDILREETRPADMVSAYIDDACVPDVRSVYDHYSLASFMNMPDASPFSRVPAEVIAGRGSVAPKIVANDRCNYFVHKAKMGEYLDVHAWVFTPPSFLLVMAQLVSDGYVSFRLRQFYPTNIESHDRGNSSFTIVLERVSSDVSPAELRASYLKPLGE
jgi:hypothetical protein